MNQENSCEPSKRIHEEPELALFHRSVASQRLHRVMACLVNEVAGIEVPNNQLNPAIVTRNIQNDEVINLSTVDTSDYSPSETANIVLNALSCFGKLIDETPPLVGPRRFGNMACREWHRKVKSQSLKILNGLSSDEDLMCELNYYLVNSFGSEVRLDYGSGHELSFIAFVGGLFQTGLFKTGESGRDILAIFSRYYDLVRRLIIDYSLEPAGSHGVWGLDDHFHFIYILGAAQFRSKVGESGAVFAQYIPPVSQVLTAHTISAYKVKNLYVNAIAFIFKLKSGPFYEHSPVLYDIHKSVSLWSKVESGLIKMYEVEVFGKFPVVQHFWFGPGLYPWVDFATSKSLPSKKIDEADLKTDLNTDHIPGLINGLQGRKTTSDNIALTGAPWAKNNTARSLPPRGAWGIKRNM